MRGGGDLASGVALRLHRAGFPVMVTELPQPLVVRRLVAFAEAVYSGEIEVEETRARRAEDLDEALLYLERGLIAVLVDPRAACLAELRRRTAAGETRFDRVILVDGRMTKQPPEIGRDSADLVIGLGPGFTAGEDCHAVIETNRGHAMGRVIWQGSAEPDTGVPERVAQWAAERVLRAPRSGLLRTRAQIGDHVDQGQVLAEVGGAAVQAPFAGVLRGLLHDEVQVTAGTKIGDVDPRGQSSYAARVSDNSLAVGGGVLEAILSREELRAHLWDFHGGRDAAV